MKSKIEPSAPSYPPSPNLNGDRACPQILPPPYFPSPNSSQGTHYPLPSPGFSSPSQHHNKFSYMDFLPRVTSTKFLISKLKSETFSELMERVNNWLVDHSEVTLVTCEMVEWSGKNSKTIFTDETYYIKGQTNLVLKGIRIWYFAPPIPISNIQIEKKVKILKCLTFPKQPITSYIELINSINSKFMGNSSIPTPSRNGHLNGNGNGEDLSKYQYKILSVITDKGKMNGYELDVENCCNKKYEIYQEIYYLFSRVFFLVYPDSCIKETIGYQDFIPSRTNRSKINKGYELFSDLFDRISRWVVRQQSVRFINIQSFPFKLKKDLADPEKCKYKYHGAKTTYFLNGVRVNFSIPQIQGPPLETRLSYRTFFPRVTKGNPDPKEILKYEDLWTLIDRINLWLKITKAKLHSAETLVVEKAGGSPELTFIKSDGLEESLGMYLFNIRIYLDGDYVESMEALNLLQ